MSSLPSLARKFVIGGMAAVTIAGSLAASSISADAAPRGHGFGRHHGHGGHHGYHHRHHGRAWVGPAIIGGLALGALAAAPYYGPRCWVEPQRVLNRWGHVVVRNVEVCR